MIDFFQPLAEFGFLRRALVATVAVALGCAPLGCLLVLRRLSLVGDAMAHAVLPGAALGYLVAGLSLPALTLGGFAGALIVALAAAAVSHHGAQREDSSLAAFTLIALALGVLLVSLRGSPVDLQRLLFGSVLAVDDAALCLMASVTTATLLALALAWRLLVAEALDPAFLRQAGGPVGTARALLMVLLVANLVSGFVALGSLMVLGLMMLPAASARCWVKGLPAMSALAAVMAVLAAVAGLLVSVHVDLPSGPAIVLVCGAVYLVSVLLGPRGGMWRRAVPARVPGRVS